MRMTIENQAGTGERKSTWKTAIKTMCICVISRDFQIGNSQAAQPALRQWAAAVTCANYRTTSIKRRVANKRRVF